MRTLRLPILAMAAPILLAGACGKDDNAHPPSVVEFPHAFPEAPRALSTNIAPAWTSGHGLAATDQWLYITDRDNKALVRMDRATLDVTDTLNVDSKPEQIVVGPDGAAIVTLRTTGEVARIENMRITARVHVGVETYGIAMSDDGATVYVTLPREMKLVTLDATTLEEVARTDTFEEPRGLAYSPGPQAFVSVIHQHDNAIEFVINKETGAPDEQQAFPVGLRNGNPADHLTQTRLHGLKATRALAGAVNPENGEVYIAHVVAAPGTEDDFRASEVASTPDAPTPVSDGGGGYGSTAIPGATVNLPTRPVEVTVTGSMLGGALGAESEFPVQDPASGENMLALVDQPSDIAAHPTHTLLFMTGYGTDNVLVMSTSEQDPVRSPVGIISVGHAPRAIAFSPDGKSAYVLNDFDLSVSEIDVTPFLNMRTFENPGAVGGENTSVNQGVPVPMGAMDMAGGEACSKDFGCNGGVFASSDMTPMSQRVDPIRVQQKQAKAFGIDPIPAEIRRGARVYTYARNENLSHAGQFACASCHFEGREDKLVWFIPDGPRQTPSLAGRLLGTAPFNWNGSKDELKSNMAQTVERMGGLGLSTQELDDLEKFLLHGLEVPVNPNLAKDGELTAVQQLGKDIFNSSEAACASCHRPDRNFTDGLDHDVQTASQIEVARFEVQRATNMDVKEPGMLNTPTLKGLFYTAPYLHDGSAPTLEEVLDRTATTMGHTDHLTVEQKGALVAYLKTL